MSYMNPDKATTYKKNPAFATAPNNYIRRSNTDTDPGHDNNIACYTNGEKARDLQAKCEADPNCMAYVVVPPNTWWGPQSGGCLKKNATSMVNRSGLTLYIKKNTTDSEGYKYTPNVIIYGGDRE